MEARESWIPRSLQDTLDVLRAETSGRVANGTDFQVHIGAHPDLIARRGALETHLSTLQNSSVGAGIHREQARN